MTTIDSGPVVDEEVVDGEAVEAFVGKALGDIAGFTTTLLAAIGDQLGLFRALASHGPLTSGELAEWTQTDERYAREWLGGMTQLRVPRRTTPRPRSSCSPRSTHRSSLRRAAMSSSAVRSRCCVACPACTTSCSRSSGPEAASHRRPTTPTCGTGWRGSPPAGSRTCSSRSGSRRCRKCSPRWKRALTSPTSGVAEVAD